MEPPMTNRTQLLAEAVVSAYINELSPRERPSHRPARERDRAVARVTRLRREGSRQRPELAPA
jgi:hypothetical protein